MGLEKPPLVPGLGHVLRLRRTERRCSGYRIKVKQAPDASYAVEQPRHRCFCRAIAPGNPYNQHRVNGYRFGPREWSC